MIMIEFLLHDLHEHFTEWVLIIATLWLAHRTFQVAKAEAGIKGALERLIETISPVVRRTRRKRTVNAPVSLVKNHARTTRS